MSDNLTTSPEQEQPEEDEAVVEFTSREDYIASCYYCISAVDGFDTGLMTKEDQRRVQRIQRKCLRILDECVNEMYDEIFDEPDND